MRRFLLLGVIVLVAGGAVIGDGMARAAAESRIERQVGARVPRYTVEADIDSTPFVLRLLTSGEVAQTRVRLFAAGANAGRGDIAEAVDVRLYGARLDRDALFDGDARVTHIDRGTAEVWISAQTLSTLLRVPVRIEGSAVVVGPSGASVPVAMTVRDSSLVLATAVGPERRVAIPERFSMCVDAEVVVRSRSVVLVCAFTELPAELMGRAA